MARLYHTDIEGKPDVCASRASSASEKMTCLGQKAEGLTASESRSVLPLKADLGLRVDDDAL
jgi:hypothetical protein